MEICYVGTCFVGTCFVCEDLLYGDLHCVCGAALYEGTCLLCGDLLSGDLLCVCGPVLWGPALCLWTCCMWTCFVGTCFFVCGPVLWGLVLCVGTSFVNCFVGTCVYLLNSDLLYGDLLGSALWGPAFWGPSLCVELLCRDLPSDKLLCEDLYGDSPLLILPMTATSRYFLLSCLPYSPSRTPPSLGGRRSVDATYTSLSALMVLATVSTATRFCLASCRPNTSITVRGKGMGRSQCHCRENNPELQDTLVYTSGFQTVRRASPGGRQRYSGGGVT